ncbi:MAG: HEXXH motif-containing putative peptide modification protein [Pyrinomonadaceae bacterium]
MRFLNSGRVRSNMELAASHLLGERPPPSCLKKSFITAMNRAQSTTIQTLPDDVYVEFDNPALVDYLVKRAVFSAGTVANGIYLPESERVQVRNNIEAARHLINQIDPHLNHLITSLVGSVAAYRIPDRAGGTVSCCIGLIWLSPSQKWNVQYYAEMLVHEFVHNSVFLEDMVHGVMPNPTLLEHEKALTISVIRKTRRPYDKALHSACVAAALMYFYHRLGDESAAETYLAPMRHTIRELYEHDNELHEQGLDLLADNGRQIINDLQRFIEGPNYAIIHDALASQ